MCSSDLTSGYAVAKNPGATFYVPTENEWYKAAYYSPTLNSGAGGYFIYATQSNSDPGNIVGSSANQANYYAGNGYSVTQSPDGPNSDQNYLTDVGAFANSASYYGTFDQSGNVHQWNDLNGTTSLARGTRGGAWSGGDPIILSAYFRDVGDPSWGGDTAGFRLASPVAASVPEIDPAGFGSVLALVTGALGLVERRRLKAKLAA